VDVLAAASDPALLGRLKASLERNGHRVLLADDGAEAWELFRNGDCHVVISAIAMAGMDGRELARRIRAERRGGDAYVMLMIERDDRAEVQEALAAGADDCLLGEPSDAMLALRLAHASRLLAMQETLGRQFRELDAVSRRLRRDLQSAEQAQRSLLPSAVPAVPELEFGWFLKSCDEVGGDTLNVFRLDERHLGFYVLDVSGHGVASALLAVQVSRFLHPLLGAASLMKKAIPAAPGYRLAEPEEVLHDLNDLFPAQPRSMQFFTMAYGLYNLDDHHVRIASAGHPGPLVVHQSGAVEAPTLTGHPIGFFSTAVAGFSQIELTLGRGDRLLLYSDGASEASDQLGVTFGAARLGETLAKARDRELQPALEQVVEALSQWRSWRPMADDVSLLAIGRRP
jgi:sigma-B regulation protein RsbU (phosphoserine phosphatase)